MIADFFWDIATSNVVLIAILLIAVGAFVVAHTPRIVERFWPQAFAFSKAAALVQVAAWALLMFLVGFRVADERAETKQLKNDLAFTELQIENAKATAQDAERLKADAQEKAKEAEDKLNDYRTRFGDSPEAVCAFTPDDLKRLRNLGLPKRR